MTAETETEAAVPEAAAAPADGRAERAGPGAVPVAGVAVPVAGAAVPVAGAADGTELPPLTVTVTRADLVRYAGASEDFNPVHWNPRVAHEAGLPDVIAHGMLTMAIAARAVTDWTGDPGAVVEYRTRFSRPVPVPDSPGGALVEVGGRVVRWLGDGLVRIDLTVVCGGTKVLSEARAVVRLKAEPAPG